MYRYYLIRAVVLTLIGILLFLSGCDGMKCGLRGKINPKTGEKYIGFACNGEW